MVIWYKKIGGVGLKKITNNKEFMAKMAVITILVSLGQITGIALYYKKCINYYTIFTYNYQHIKKYQRYN